MHPLATPLGNSFCWMQVDVDQSQYFVEDERSHLSAVLMIRYRAIISSANIFTLLSSEICMHYNRPSNVLWLFGLGHLGKWNVYAVKFLHMGSIVTELTFIVLLSYGTLLAVKGAFGNLVNFVIILNK